MILKYSKHSEWIVFLSSFNIVYTDPRSLLSRMTGIVMMGSWDSVKITLTFRPEVTGSTPIPILLGNLLSLQLPAKEMDESWIAPSQWETALLSNAVSHWLGANLESALTGNAKQEAAAPQIWGKKLEIGHGTWWPLLGLLYWYPLIFVKSRQLIWRSVPDFQMNCSDMTENRVPAINIYLWYFRWYQFWKSQKKHCKFQKSQKLEHVMRSSNLLSSVGKRASNNSTSCWQTELLHFPNWTSMNGEKFPFLKIFCFLGAGGEVCRLMRARWIVARPGRVALSLQKHGLTAQTQGHSCILGMSLKWNWELGLSVWMVPSFKFDWYCRAFILFFFRGLSWLDLVIDVPNFLITIRCSDRFLACRHKM